MTHSQEPSYYEIALTNKQVLGFFVVLLLCVVGAFFSGIWLGKKQPAGVASIADMETVSEAVAGEEEPLEELNFFSDNDSSAATSRKTARRSEKPAEPAEVPTAGNAGTTLKEDVEAVAPTRQAAQSSASEPPPAPEPAASRQPEPTRPAAGGYVIQVFSSPDGSQARKLKDRLVAGGYEAFLLPEEVGGRTMHRVRIGPYTERADAARVAPEVAKAFQVETWITRNE